MTDKPHLLLPMALLMALHAGAATAQQLDPKVLRDTSPAMRPSSAGTPRPNPRLRTPSSCAEYGAGFVRVESTGTCMRIGGGVDIDVRAR
jgi:hypothetical protein